MPGRASIWHGLTSGFHFLVVFVGGLLLLLCFSTSWPAPCFGVGLFVCLCPHTNIAVVCVLQSLAASFALFQRLAFGLPLVGFCFLPCWASAFWLFCLLAVLSLAVCLLPSAVLPLGCFVFGCLPFAFGFFSAFSGGFFYLFFFFVFA